MSTEVNNETGVAIDAAEFAALADHVLRVMHVNPRAELSILFIDPEPMAELPTQIGRASCRERV